jgi:hypothetical protein
MPWAVGGRELTGGVLRRPNIPVCMSGRRLLKSVSKMSEPPVVRHRCRSFAFQASQLRIRRWPLEAFVTAGPQLAARQLVIALHDVSVQRGDSRTIVRCTLHPAVVASGSESIGHRAGISEYPAQYLYPGPNRSFELRRLSFSADAPRTLRESWLL